MKTLRARAATLWSNLANVGERQPLARPALAVLLFLDVFVLVSVFDGLDEHTRQLRSPDDLVPSVCQEIVIARRWTSAARLDRLADAYPGVHAAAGEPRWAGAHPDCAPLLAAIDVVWADDALARQLRLRRDVRGELRDLDQALASLRPAHDSARLEAVARDRASAGLSAIEQELREKTGALEEAQAKLRTLESALDGAAPVAALWTLVDGLGDADRVRLERDLRSATFWFPAKRLGMQLLFLGPLLAAFVAWSVRSARRGPGVQTLVSSHLVIVAAIPVFLRVIEAVYDVIPKVLLARLVALLARLNLVALWHYLAIAVATAAGLTLVLLLQRRIFSPERLAARRIGRGLCQDCGRRLPSGARACPSCGFAQFQRCPSCGGAAHARARHCSECGAVLTLPAAAPDGAPRPDAA